MQKPPGVCNSESSSKILDLMWKWQKNILTLLTFPPPKWRKRNSMFYCLMRNVRAHILFCISIRELEKEQFSSWPGGVRSAAGGGGWLSWKILKNFPCLRQWLSLTTNFVTQNWVQLSRGNPHLHSSLLNMMNNAGYFPVFFFFSANSKISCTITSGYSNTHLFS